MTLSVFLDRDAQRDVEVHPGARRESMRIFSYHLWYLVLPEIEHAEVFAVLHHHRGPDALSSRL